MPCYDPRPTKKEIDLSEDLRRLQHKCDVLTNMLCALVNEKATLDHRTIRGWKELHNLIDKQGMEAHIARQRYYLFFRTYNFKQFDKENE